MFEGAGLPIAVFIVLVVFLGLATVFASFYSIGPTQIGLVEKDLARSCPATTQ